MAGKYDFFPIGRAMALSHMNDNVTDEKLEEMAKDIKFLLQRAAKEASSFRIYCLLYDTQLSVT